MATQPDLTDEYAATEALLWVLPKDASIGRRVATGFFASCYWPEDDVIRGKQCFGTGRTLAGAVSAMLVLREKAQRDRKKLRTAAECKTAVLNLIREHDAAPASFRDAVDELDVA